jgi:hypothetical protein
MSLVALVLGAAVAMTAAAQGRHDEKPHGSTKPATGQSEASGPSTGGRHDERPHGTKKKAAPRKQATKDASKGAPESGK